MYRSDVIVVSDSYEDTLNAIRTATTPSGGGGGVSDGNKGDITVSGSGSVWKLNASAMRKIMAINAS
jgi:hypothetical protein